jgi:hypothetical protein
MSHPRFARYGCQWARRDPAKGRRARVLMPADLPAPRGAGLATGRPAAADLGYGAMKGRDPGANRPADGSDRIEAGGRQGPESATGATSRTTPSVPTISTSWPAGRRGPVTGQVPSASLARPRPSTIGSISVTRWPM